MPTRDNDASDEQTASLGLVQSATFAVGQPRSKVECSQSTLCCSGFVTMTFIHGVAITKVRPTQRKE